MNLLFKGVIFRFHVRGSRGKIFAYMCQGGGASVWESQKTTDPPTVSKKRLHSWGFPGPQTWKMIIHSPELPCAEPHITLNVTSYHILMFDDVCRVFFLQKFGEYIYITTTGPPFGLPVCHLRQKRQRQGQAIQDAAEKGDLACLQQVAQFLICKKEWQNLWCFFIASILWHDS